MWRTAIDHRCGLPSKSHQPTWWIWCGALLTTPPPPPCLSSCCTAWYISQIYFSPYLVLWEQYQSLNATLVSAMMRHAYEALPFLFLSSFWCWQFHHFYYFVCIFPLSNNMEYWTRTCLYTHICITAGSWWIPKGRIVSTVLISFILLRVFKSPFMWDQRDMYAGVQELINYPYVLTRLTCRLPPPPPSVCYLFFLDQPPVYNTPIMNAPWSGHLNLCIG